MAKAKCKTPGRRKPRRAQPRARPDLDDDLAHLASVIAEFQLDNNAHGWFRPAWRDGWNAVILAYEVWRGLYGSAPFSTEFEQGIGRYLSILIQRRLIAVEAYHQAVDDITALTMHGQGRSAQLLIASLRCYQVLASNSSGGGEVYNDVLKKALDGIEVETYPVESFADIILEWRCHDAIGTTSQLQQDANDRLRRAFRTAWQRGLYLAAYSLPPSVDYSIKPTILKD